jgi:hypothetical protein
MYKTGGLETTPDTASDILRVDDIDYVVSNKFKTLLRDSFVNWGTFLEIYKKSIPDSVLFEQVVKLLDVEETGRISYGVHAQTIYAIRTSVDCIARYLYYY